MTLARLARHVEVEKQQKEEKNRAFRVCGCFLSFFFLWLLSLMFYQITELFVRKLNRHLYNQKIHNWIQVQHEICIA